LDAPTTSDPTPIIAATSPTIMRGDSDFLRVTAALFFGGFSTFALLYSVQPLMPVFARVFHLAPSVASLSLSATTGVLAVSMIIAGSISEVLGRKRVMVASLAASSARHDARRARAELAATSRAASHHWPGAFRPSGSRDGLSLR
jgi:MFS transporter, YNFM family, putative membrane transport protein